MDRRETLKSLLLGGLAGGMLVNGCTPAEVSEELNTQSTEPKEKYYGRTAKEKIRDEKLSTEQFFNEHEIATIATLCDLILPANAQFGGAKEAGVPEFIEFIVKDIPRHQLPIRGGLMWLDNYSNSEYALQFISCTQEQQKAILDTIAYPVPDIPSDQQVLGIKFFSLLRNLTLTGYYTTKMGLEDLGYVGNTPNVWDGVPEDVLKKHGMQYDEEWLSKCINQDSRMDIAQWDEDGNLIS